MGYTLQNGSPVYPAQVTYQALSLTSNIVVSWPFSFASSTIIARINDISADANRSITLPDATLASVGQDILFNNISIYTITILANDGSTVLATIDSGDIIYFYLRDNTTGTPSNGLWRTIPFGAGMDGITALTAQSSDSSITITNGAITPPGGTINFKLPTSIKNLNDVATVGFAVITGKAPLTWNTRSITAGDNIDITNGDGVNSNPVISLNPEVAGLTSLEVGDTTFTGDTLTVTEDQSLAITTSGTGLLLLNDFTVLPNGDATINGDLEVTGVFNNPLTPKAFCLFTDALLGGETSGIEIINQVNVSSVTGGGGVYTITFEEELATANYGITINIGSAIEDDLPIVSHGFSLYSAQTTTTCSIAVVDASGQYVEQALNGVTVAIFSST